MTAAATSNRFWRGRRVLVTGHTGFKGGWLSLWLQRLGRGGLRALATPSRPTRRFTSWRGVGEGMRDERTGDVRDPARSPRRCAQRAPEVVIHLAAQPLVRRSFAEPRETFEINVHGHRQRARRGARGRRVRAVVVVTSDKCYENREWDWGYREDEAMGGHDPYSSSKGARRARHRAPTGGPSSPTRAGPRSPRRVRAT